MAICKCCSHNCLEGSSFLMFDYNRISDHQETTSCALYLQWTVQQSPRAILGIIQRYKPLNPLFTCGVLADKWTQSSSEFLLHGLLHVLQLHDQTPLQFILACRLQLSCWLVFKLKKSFWRLHSQFVLKDSMHWPPSLPLSLRAAKKVSSVFVLVKIMSGFTWYLTVYERHGRHQMVQQKQNLKKQIQDCEL